MRPKGTAEQLAARRQRALRLLSQGHKPAEVAAAVGVTERTIRRWREPPKPPQPGRRPPGRPPRLSAAQLEQLDGELRQGAFEHGYAGDYWTLDRIGQLIWQLFGLRYHASGVWHVLRRMGWSCQKAQRRSIARDDDAVARWRRYVWPQIKKCARLKAKLRVVDESGFSLLSPLKRSWSPRGETPTIRTSLSHHQRLNLLGALCVSPGKRQIRLTVHSHRRTLRGEEVLAFLEALLRKHPGPLVLVWDRHPIHQRRSVQDFLARQTRLHVYAFPPGAPELNPVEWIWQQVDDYTAGTAPRDRQALRANVMAGLARVRRSPQRMWAGFAGAKLNVRK